MPRTVLALVIVSCLGSPLLAQTPAPDATALVKQGRQLNAQGRQAEAIALYRQALALEPESLDVHMALGVALDLEGRYGEARTHFARAIAVAPPEAREQPMEAMGISFAFEARPAEAVKYYQPLFDTQVADRSFAGAAGTANALARIYLESGDTANALKWYQTGYETAKREPGQPDAELRLWEMRWHHALARIAARRGDKATAKREVDTFTALMQKRARTEDEEIYRYLLGYVAFYAREYATAVAELQKGNVKDPFIASLVAQAYEKTGDEAKARELWRLVLASNAHNIQNAFARPLARKRP